MASTAVPPFLSNRECRPAIHSQKGIFKRIPFGPGSKEERKEKRLVGGGGGGLDGVL